MPTDSIESMTVAQLRTALDAAHVVAPPRAKKADLVALVRAQVSTPEPDVEAAPTDAPSQAIVDAVERGANLSPEQRVAQPAGTVATIDQSRVQLLKDTIAKDLTDPEFALFVEVCNRTMLDPFARQIHAVIRSSRGERKLVIQTGIDGLRVIADRTGAYAGSGDPEIGPLDSSSPPRPQWARVTVRKIVQGQVFDVTRTAQWAEYYPGEGGVGTMWRNMPQVMLPKCAEAQALRAAFPADLSGLYVDEEMHQADTIDVHGTVQPHAPAPQAAPAPTPELPDVLQQRKDALAAAIRGMPDERQRALLTAWKGTRPTLVPLRRLDNADDIRRATILAGQFGASVADVPEPDALAQQMANDFGGHVVDVVEAPAAVAPTIAMPDDDRPAAAVVPTAEVCVACEQPFDDTMPGRQAAAEHPDHHVDCAPF